MAQMHLPATPASPHAGALARWGKSIILDKTNSYKKYDRVKTNFNTCLILSAMPLFNTFFVLAIIDQN
jgi:hypothetical protein